MSLHTWQLVVVSADQLDRSSLQRLLERDKAATYELVFAALLSDAVEHIRTQPANAMIVSLAGPDMQVAQALRQVTATRPDMPVLVIYRGDNDEFAQECRNNGAAEAFRDKHLNAMTLRLAIAAIIGKAQMGDLRLAERRAGAYQVVAESLVNGWLTATQGWNPLLRKSRPEKFAEIAEAYEQLLLEWVRNRREKKRQSRAPLRHIGNLIEQAGAGPADVVDLHAHAVAKAVRGMDEAKARGAAWLAHGLALDILGRLEAVKERAPHHGASMRRTSALNFRRTSDVSTVRRTSDIGILRRNSEVSQRRKSAGFDGPVPRSGLHEGVAPRRKSDMVVSVDGRKIER